MCKICKTVGIFGSYNPFTTLSLSFDDFEEPVKHTGYSQSLSDSAALAL